MICYDRVGSESSFHEVEKYGTITTVPFNSKNNVMQMLLNLFSAVPYNISKYKTRSLEGELRKYLAATKPDIVHIDHLHMVWTTDVIRSFYPDVPIVLREHNFETNIMKRFSENQKNPVVRLYSGIQYRKLKKYEAEWCGKVDSAVMISDEDEREVKRLNPNISSCMIPAGIDVEIIGRYLNTEKIANSICHIGPMDWFPNYDAVNWFLESIFPLVIEKNPQIRFYIYGKGTETISIPEKYRQYVFLKGFVNDLSAELSKMQLLVVPLRIGGGIRIKIIETMALGMNILSTSIGCEGIPAENGKHILKADSENQFADTIVRFFSGQYNNDQMISESIELIRREFTWIQIGKKFTDVYTRLMENKKKTL